jgi:hypothetical protein
MVAAVGLYYSVYMRTTITVRASDGLRKALANPGNPTPVDSAGTARDESQGTRPRLTASPDPG